MKFTRCRVPCGWTRPWSAWRPRRTQPDPISSWSLDIAAAWHRSAPRAVPPKDSITGPCGTSPGPQPNVGHLHIRSSGSHPHENLSYPRCRACPARPQPHRFARRGLSSAVVTEASPEWSPPSCRTLWALWWAHTPLSWSAHTGSQSTPREFWVLSSSTGFPKMDLWPWAERPWRNAALASAFRSWSPKWQENWSMSCRLQRDIVGDWMAKSPTSRSENPIGLHRGGTPLASCFATNFEGSPTIAFHAAVVGDVGKITA